MFFLQRGACERGSVPRLTRVCARSGILARPFPFRRRHAKPSLRTQLDPYSPIRAMFRLADEMERAGGGPVYG